MTLKELRRVLFAYQRRKREMCESWVKAAREGRGGLACDGCTTAYCCDQLPLATQMEGVVIAMSLIDQGRIEVMNAAVLQGKTQTALLEKYGYTPGEDGSIPPAMVEEACLEWFDSGQSCAFLLHDRCAIYSVRPTICHTYYTAARCTHRYGAGEMVPTLNNAEPIAYNLMYSSVVLSELLGLGDDIYPPMALGTAVEFGMDVITDLLGLSQEATDGKK